MFVECIKNNGVPYLRLVQGVRVTNKAGYRTSQKKVILSIGPLSRFDDGQPDYVQRLRQSFKAGKPLIAALEPYCTKEQPREKYTFTIEEGSPECVGHPKLFSHLLLERIMEELGLHALFATYKSMSKIEFDVYSFFKLLVLGRVLNPASKIATTRQNEDYYEPILKNFNPDNVYDTLSFIYENKDKIIRRMNTNLVKKAGRSPEIIYYDVTNFYFEIEEPDADVLDENGNVLEKGTRKMGVCKEERKQPIVQMGLFMDDNGIPIAIDSFPGNTLDHLTLIPALKNNIDNLELSRFILIGDRGMCNYPNLLHILDAGNGYIISKSLLKSPKEEKEWAYSDEGYVKVSEDFRYKSRIIRKTVKDEHGAQRSIEEKVVVYWSRKFHDRSVAENKSFLAFLQKLQQNPENFRVTSIQAKSIRKFIKKDYLDQKTGEIVDSSTLKPMVDFEKVKEFQEHMGYYQIVSSELNLEASEIIDKYHGLTQIEDQFRVMKGTLDTRPIFVRNKEHIEAHLLTCFVALVIMRIIQNRIVQHEAMEESGKRNYWSYGMSADKVQRALNKWKVDKLPGDLYRFMETDDPDLQRILKAFEIEIPAKLFRRAELKSIKTGVEIFKQAHKIGT